MRESISPPKGRSKAEIKKQNETLRADWRYGNFRESDHDLMFRLSEYPADIPCDHDHCLGCWKTISLVHPPPAEREGYVSSGYWMGKRLIQNRWVCKQCFSDYRELMNWGEIDENGWVEIDF